jgi:hypothetical protein
VPSKYNKKKDLEWLRHLYFALESWNTISGTNASRWPLVRLIMSFTQMWTCYPTNLSFQIIHIKFNIISHHKSKNYKIPSKRSNSSRGFPTTPRVCPNLAPKQIIGSLNLESNQNWTWNQPSVGTWAWNQIVIGITRMWLQTFFLCNFQFSMQNMYWVFAIWEAGKL